MWFSVSDQSSLVGLFTQDYKSLCAAVTICVTLVNTQRDGQTHTHMHTDIILISLHGKLSQIVFKAQPDVSN